MKRKSTASTALVFLLAMAARTQASPIHPFHPGQTPMAFATHYEGHGLKSLIWSNPDAHRHGRFGAHPSPMRNGNPDLGLPTGYAKDPWAGFRFHPALCGKSPGAGVVRELPEETEALLPDPEQGSPEEEDSPAWIADTRGDSDEAPRGIPAVPEPGTLALMSAGLLGLLAARSVLKAG